MKYKISELASLLNVSTNTIRRYESKGYIHSEHVVNNNYRYFNDIDAIKFMNIRLLRKYDFSHEEIDTIIQSNWNETASIYHDKINELDSLIEHYTYLRNRLNSNMQLLEKMIYNPDAEYFRDCIPFSYISYQRGSVLLTDCNRKISLQTLLNESPYLFKIYILKKEDINLDNPHFFSAWAVKTNDFETLQLTNSPFIEKYEKQTSYMNFMKVPLSSDLLNSCKLSQLILSHLRPSIIHLNDMGFDVNGDIIGLEISVMPEKNIQTQQILVNIPIIQK